jgi:hypothetical protein
LSSTSEIEKEEVGGPSLLAVLLRILREEVNVEATT